MKYVIYILYRYYLNSKNTKEIAYFSAICLIGVGLFMNIFTILLFFFQKDFDFLFQNNIEDSSYNPKLRLMKYMEAFLLFVPYWLICYEFFPEKEIKSIKMNPKEIKIGKIIFFVYYIISILLLVLAIRNNT